MKHKLFYALAGIFLSISTAFTFTDDANDIIERIIAQLENYRQKSPQEKLYLHFDKSYYVAGETMWFKGYLFDGISHAVDSVSRVVYVDLINESTGKTIIKRMLKCLGSTHGDISLPDTLSEGVYHIRAYTSYMRNFSEELFFHQDFKVWQGSAKNQADNAKIQSFSEVADLQFFPEGGNLIEDIDSRVGLKALNVAGKSVEVEGYILDNKKDSVVAFRSEHKGMGVFNFKPESNQNYTAIIQDNNGKIRSFPFPTALKVGFTMAVDNINLPDKIKIVISNSSPKTIDKASEMIVVVHQRGELCYMGKIKDTQKFVLVSIPKKQILDDGIMQITLLNAQGEALCERLVFSNQHKQLNLKIKTDKTSYKIREKVIVDLEATDAEGKPVEGNFSVAVTDANQALAEAHPQNLLTYLLLSSDVSNLHHADYYASLRGNVEEPDYYFDTVNAESATRHLDMLMMTQGWRRFVWKDLMAKKQISMNYSVESGLAVTGTALRPNGKAMNNAMVTMMLKVPKFMPNSQIAMVDSTGKYGFYNLDFSDTAKVFIQGVKKNVLSNFNITIDGLEPSPSVRVVKIPFSPIAFDAKDVANFLKRTNENLAFEKMLKLNNIKLLDEVSVKAKKNEENDVRRFYGSASTSLQVTPAICGGSSNVFQMLQNQSLNNVRISGNVITILGASNFGSTVDAINPNSPAAVAAQNNADPYGTNGGPLYLLNGVMITAEMVPTIQTCDIDKIDILKPGAESSVFGARGYFGVVSILTKNGGKIEYSKMAASDNAAIQQRTGYYTAREFFAPKYDVAIADHAHPDFRSTLHWQPNVRTNSNGKATLTYWNTDAITNIHIVAQGVSGQGRVGVAKMEYVVK